MYYKLNLFCYRFPIQKKTLWAPLCTAFTIKKAASGAINFEN